jgi:hypothetical protein
MGNPWEKVHIDICGPFPTGDYILGIIDASTRWPDTHIIKSTNSKVITNCLDITFSTHGFPETIVTDNAPNLTSIEMSEYCKQNGISHHRTIPYYPQGNAEIERFYRTLGKAIRTTHAAGRDWKQSIYQFLLTYRNTPHCSTQASPAKLLMNRTLRDKIPSMPEAPTTTLIKAQATDSNNKLKSKTYFDKRFKVKSSDIPQGDFVLLRQVKRNKLSTKYKSTPYQVTDRKGTRIEVKCNENFYFRSVNNVKKIPNYNHSVIDYATYDKISDSDSSNESSSNADTDIEGDVDDQSVPLPNPQQRPRRVRRHPQWLNNYELN